MVRVIFLLFSWQIYPTWSILIGWICQSVHWGVNENFQGKESPLLVLDNANKVWTHPHYLYWFPLLQWARAWENNTVCVPSYWISGVTTAETLPDSRKSMVYERNKASKEIISFKRNTALTQELLSKLSSNVAEGKNWVCVSGTLARAFRGCAKINFTSAWKPAKVYSINWGLFPIYFKQPLWLLLG